MVSAKILILIFQFISTQISKNPVSNSENPSPRNKTEILKNSFNKSNFSYHILIIFLFRVGICVLRILERVYMTVLNYIYVIVDVLKMEFRNSAKSITLSLAADEFGKHVIISSPYSFTDF